MAISRLPIVYPNLIILYDFDCQFLIILIIISNFRKYFLNYSAQFLPSLMATHLPLLLGPPILRSLPALRGLFWTSADSSLAKVDLQSRHWFTQEWATVLFLCPVRLARACDCPSSALLSRPATRAAWSSAAAKWQLHAPFLFRWAFSRKRCEAKQVGPQAHHSFSVASRCLLSRQIILRRCLPIGRHVHFRHFPALRPLSQARRDFLSTLVQYP